jgi:hypothetical protein
MSTDQKNVGFEFIVYNKYYRDIKHQMLLATASGGKSLVCVR